MGRLVIAHHKSYHPYRRDNIERVRRDEEEARQIEAREEGRMMLADSEARIDLLRERAGIQNSGKYDDSTKKGLRPTSSEVSAAATSRHINLFEDLEHNAVALAARVSKKTETVDTERGFALAPSAKDLKPWYSEKTRVVDQQEGIEDDRRKRDAARKSLNDPLTSITQQLASLPSSSSSSKHGQRIPVRPQISSRGPSEVDARLARESSEHERARELFRRKMREIEGGETPTVYPSRGSYGDVFNRKEVEEAHRFRERRWESWDRGARTESRSDRYEYGRHRR